MSKLYKGDASGKAQEVQLIGLKGDTGAQGPTGPAGPQGPQGVGVPSGGTVGQVLTKTASGTEWANIKPKITFTGENIEIAEIGSFFYAYLIKSVSMPATPTVSSPSAPFGGFISRTVELEAVPSQYQNMYHVIKADFNDISMEVTRVNPGYYETTIYHELYMAAGGSVPCYLPVGTILFMGKI